MIIMMMKVKILTKTRMKKTNEKNLLMQIDPNMSS